MKLPSRRATIRRTMRLLLLAALLAPCLIAAGNEDVRAKQRELDALKAEIAKISEGVSHEQQSRDSLARELTQVEKRLSALQRALASVSQEIRQHQQAAKKLSSEQAALASEQQQQSEVLAAQLKAAYLVGRSANTRLLFSQQDPARTARLLQYFSYLQRDRERAMLALASAQEQIAHRAATLRQTLAELASLEQTRKQALAGIAAQAQSRQRLLDQASARLAARQNDLAQHQAERARLEALLEQLASVTARRPPALSGRAFASLRGRLQPPVEGPTLARFAQAKAGGSRWNGLWLGAAADTPVRAIADGRVVYVGWMHHFGLVLVLDHGEGYFSLYGHNGSSNSSVGDDVTAGQQIAAAGNTGGHRQNGVYLEIRRGRSALNPQDWLAK